MASNKRASFLIKDQTPAELINGALDFIVQVSSQKKHTKLQSECKSLMEHFNTNLPTVSLSPSNEIPSRLPPASVEHSVESTDLAAGPEPPHPEAATDSSEAAGEGGQASVAEETASASEPEPTPQDAPNNGTVETPAVPQGGASEVPPSPSTTGPMSQESAVSSGSTAMPPPSPAKKVRVNEGLHLTEDNLTKLLTVLRQAQDTRLPKVMEMIQDVLQRLIAHGLIKGSADALKASTSEEVDKETSGIEGSGVPTAAAGVIDLMCRGVEGGEEAELQVLKGLLTAVSSSTLQVHGESLLRVVRTCYNIYLASKSEINQTTAKACLTQMLTVVFHRMEADSEVVPMTPIVVAHLIQPTGSDDLSNPMLQFVQTFVNKALIDLEAALYPPVPSDWGADQSDEVEAPEDVVFDKDDMDAKSWEVSVYKKSMEEERKSTEDNDNASQASQATSDPEFSQQSGILRRDAFLVFRALCKLSMKAPSEGLSDPFQARGKALSLELVKILLENSGRVFRSSPKFIGAIKQYLCMSLLKNCSSPSPQAFQLSCSIFGTLLQRFRDAMKAEIGVFFPMILLRVLEAHSSSFQSKSTVLRCLQQHCLDSQLLVDLFVNYDCDLEAGNLFERTVNTLVKVAQRNSVSSDTPLTPVQDSALRLDSMQSLVCILRSLATWIDRQPEHSLDAASADAESSQEVVRERTETCDVKEGPAAPGALAAPSTEGDSSETTPSEAQHFVSKKAEKLELQQGVDLFKKKPAKGIKLLQKLGRLGSDPEEIANFLKTTSSLDRTAIGDFLGEREELSLKVMHAYVDGMAFSGQTFDEAIRSFLSGFRLPGEAQKIDRLMEKFAERFCKCNPNEFKSADTAYVLAYSVVMLNTDAHNPMVVKKMTKAEFLKNNRGIDDGKDVAPEYLGALYDRITTNEIRMKDEKDTGPTPGTNKATNRLGLDLLLNLFPGRRTSEGSEVSEEAIRNTQAKLREGSRCGQRFHVATHGENVRPMLQVAWPPMLAAFSLPMEESDDPHTVALCLDGFRYAIHIASVLNMETLRDAFVTSLTKFTLLVSPANMQPKNVEAIKVGGSFFPRKARGLETGG
ncbi:hypothetical protein CYMTET_6580 [Cymbomonas tetramitiformis]|uniref:SEC7 domain-containing protein n=1 Tax=Cymbomonas tetramitiformis TaxID=36881 RepID=A0AAE0LIB6_9CHLO|nr:hypothetical protein CYMTET_6580 [Cymbomonas tetramitiformis]